MLNYYTLPVRDEFHCGHPWNQTGHITFVLKDSKARYDEHTKWTAQIHSYSLLCAFMLLEAIHAKSNNDLFARI
jgi:hypothetical protein